MKKTSHTHKEASEEETNTGKPTSTQDTGPKNQATETLRGDDYSDEVSHLDSDELREADGGQKGQSGRGK